MPTARDLTTADFPKLAAVHSDSVHIGSYGGPAKAGQSKRGHARDELKKLLILFVSDVAIAACVVVWVRKGSGFSAVQAF